MKETIARFRDLLVHRMAVLEDEVRLAEALYKERHGDFRDVTLENVAVIERQARDVAHAKAHFKSMNIDEFESIEDFKKSALATLQKLYDSRAMLRSGVRMLIECVRDLPC